MHNLCSSWDLFHLTTGPQGLNNRDLKDFLLKSTKAFAIYKTNQAFENYIFHLPLQVWDHHLRFSFLSWKKLKVVHPCCKDMWELPDCITTGTGMSVETRGAGELHQSLVVLHQPQACSSQTRANINVSHWQSAWFLVRMHVCMCGIWSSVPLSSDLPFLLFIW